MSRLNRRQIPDRRVFLGTTATAGMVAFADLLRGLPPVSAADLAATGKRVRYPETIEPLVRLIEDSPRERVLERVGQRVRGGTSYQEVLAALLLAGVRNVQPRPSVGFKFHCVLVVNSCHLASMAGPDSDRWLPIFWGLDYFKRSQADEASKSGWTMGAVDELKVPDADGARGMFREAMERWDVEQADAATAGLVRTAGATEVFNEFARYAARDYRSIGHKAIFLANAWRTLQVIGWGYAEPVMRSLSFALLNHTGDPNPADNDLEPDRAWRANGERVAKIPAGWLDGSADRSSTRALIETLRESSADEAAREAAAAMASGGSGQAVWDAVFVSAGELLMRQPGIIGLHSLTTSNAVRYLWRHAENETLRKRLLLQATALVPMFRESARGRGELADRRVDRFRDFGSDGEVTSGGDSVRLADVMEDISGNRQRAADRLARYLHAGGDADEFVDEARRLIFMKGRDSHDYKFSSAVLEDYRHVSPEWRDTFLATSVFNLKGTRSADNGLVEKTRQSLA